MGRGPYKLLSTRWLVLNLHQGYRGFSCYRTTRGTFVFFLLALTLIIALLGLMLF